MPEDQGMLDTLGNAVRLARSSAPRQPCAVSARRQRPTRRGWIHATIPHCHAESPARPGLALFLACAAAVTSTRAAHAEDAALGEGARDTRAAPADRRPQRPADGSSARAASRRATSRPTTSVRAPRATPTSRGCARAASAASSGRCTSRARPMPATRGFARIQLEQIDIALRMIERYPRDSRSRSRPPTSSARTPKAASPRCSASRAATPSRIRSARCATTTGSACAT